MRGLDPIKALYGSEKAYREAQQRRELKRLESVYPPRVQEALDFIERETEAYDRRERQARCPHRRTNRIDSATIASPLRYLIVCHACELVTEHNPPHDGPDACWGCQGLVMPPYRQHPDAPNTKIVLCDRCGTWHEVSTKTS